MYRALTFALMLCCVSCWSDPPAPPETIWNVSVTHLARDLPTAQSYAGHMVSVRLDKGTYSVVDREIRVHGYVPNSPPLIVFQCRETPPAEPQTLIVTGRCRAPVRDRVWRTALADFSLTVEDCSVTQSPAP